MKGDFVYQLYKDKNLVIEQDDSMINIQKEYTYRLYIVSFKKFRIYKRLL